MLRKVVCDIRVCERNLLVLFRLFLDKVAVVWLLALLAAVQKATGSNRTAGISLFLTKITAIRSFWHAQHAITAVPRSTQPFTRCGTVK